MLITMTEKELTRLRVIQELCDRKIRQIDAANILNLTVRQIRRLTNDYRTQGPSALAHGSRGKISHRRISSDLKLHALSLISTHYSDFSPTFAHEKLVELHGIHLSVETLRQWMIIEGVWIPKIQRKPRVYQPRYRRECLGELIQIDGSHHDWFEGRSPKCCLLVFIDDATGKLMTLRFSETESSFDYMVATRQYIESHGKPLAFYSDQHAIFRVSSSKENNLTQYGRALHSLNIDLICANSPQAKGRVERANQTLQNRLVKEMRLQSINTIEEANDWVPHFIDDFNRRFAKAPMNPKNMHRSLQETENELDETLAWHDTRRVSKSLTFQYDKVIYLIEDTEENATLANKNVLIVEQPNGILTVKYGHRELKCRIFDKLAKVDQGQIVDNKRLGAVLRLAQEHQEILEQEGKRTRSKKMPSRKAQERAIAQLKTINPVLLDPSLFESDLV